MVSLWANIFTNEEEKKKKSKDEKQNEFWETNTECIGKGASYFLKTLWFLRVHAKSPKSKIKAFFFPALPLNLVYVYIYIYILYYIISSLKKNLWMQKTLKTWGGKKKNNKQQSTVKTLFHPLVFTKNYDPPPLHFWNWSLSEVCRCCKHFSFKKCFY